MFDKGAKKIQLQTIHFENGAGAIVYTHAKDEFRCLPYTICKY